MRPAGRSNRRLARWERCLSALHYLLCALGWDGGFGVRQDLIHHAARLAACMHRQASPVMCVPTSSHEADPALPSPRPGQPQHRRADRRHHTRASMVDSMRSRRLLLALLLLLLAAGNIGEPREDWVCVRLLRSHHVPPTIQPTNHAPNRTSSSSGRGGQWHDPRAAHEGQAGVRPRQARPCRERGGPERDVCMRTLHTYTQ